MTEANYSRADALREFPDIRIFAIQNRVVRGLLILEQARLCAPVVLEIFVAIEMIVGEIEMHAGARLEFLDPLELEARHLDDRDVPFAIDRVDQRRAEVAADEGAASRRFQNFAEQHDHRALAVGAGDRGDWRVEEAAREFDFSDYRNSPLGRGVQQK